MLGRREGAGQDMELAAGGGRGALDGGRRDGLGCSVLGWRAAAAGMTAVVGKLACNCKDERDDHCTMFVFFFFRKKLEVKKITESRQNMQRIIEKKSDFCSFDLQIRHW